MYGAASRLFQKTDKVRQKVYRALFKGRMAWRIKSMTLTLLILFQKYRLFDIEQMKKDLYYVMETPSIISQFDEKIMDLLHERV